MKTEEVYKIGRYWVRRRFYEDDEDIWEIHYHNEPVWTTEEVLRTKIKNARQRLEVIAQTKAEADGREAS